MVKFTQDVLGNGALYCSAVAHNRQMEISFGKCTSLNQDLEEIPTGAEVLEDGSVFVNFYAPAANMLAVQCADVNIDLEKQEINDKFDFKTTFQIDEFRRYCLLNGLDNIGLTLRYEDAITSYEQKHPQWYAINA